MGLLRTPVNRLAYDLEPLRKANYILKLTDPSGKSMPEGGSGHLHVKSLGSLVDEIASEKYRAFNSDYDVPSGKSTSSLAVNVRFFREKEVYDFFTSWSRKIYSLHSDRVGLYDQIVGQGSIEVYGPDGKDAIYDIKLVDVWPKSITIEGFDSDDDGASPASWSVNLSIGGVKWEQ